MVNYMEKVLITGARSGIGYNTGIYLAKHNYDVYLAVHTNIELNYLNKKIKTLKYKIKCLKIDITNEDDIKKIRDLDIDILINNASVGIGGSLIDINLELVRKSYETNILGTLKLSQVFLGDLFYRKKCGKIIFISSLAGILPISYIGTYALTKSSINMMAKILKKEIKQLGMNIKIKLIEPGIYNTGFNDYMLDYIKDKNIANNKKKLFKLFGSDNLNSISKTIYKATSSLNNKLIYRTSIFDSIIIKLYNLFFS